MGYPLGEVFDRKDEKGKKAYYAHDNLRFAALIHNAEGAGGLKRSSNGGFRDYVGNGRGMIIAGFEAETCSAKRKMDMEGGGIAKDSCPIAENEEKQFAKEG